MMECILFDLQFLWFMNLKATLNNLFRTRSSLFNIGTNMKWLRFINISNESVEGDVGIRAVGLMVQLILLYVLGKSVLSKNNNILVL